MARGLLLPKRHQGIVLRRMRGAYAAVPSILYHSPQATMVLRAFATPRTD